MKLRAVYFVWFSGLLFAILAAIVVQGNRILRALPYAPEVQYVRVVNGSDDAVPVSIQPDTQTGYLPPASTAPNANGLTPSEQQAFDRLYPASPST